jgi:hypothetical protein
LRRTLHCSFFMAVKKAYRTNSDSLPS